MIELRDVAYSAGGRSILDGLDLHFPAGALTVLLGPNGAGKSTTLRIAAGLLRPARGEVFYSGRPISALSTLELARRRAVLSQHAEPAFPLTAGEVVEMGRYPHYRVAPSARDRAAIDAALAAVDMVPRRNQRFSTLSAGERQKIQIARVLAQIDVPEPTRALFLDEPTAGLDVKHQLEMLRLARDLAARGVAVVAVLHDLGLALESGDRLIVLSRGQVVHVGENHEGIDEALIEGVYQVRVRRVPDPAGGRALWRFLH
ncbi:MAG TPA: ABC transporter ATP-binding protein [Candidatus Sulfotelmatobacter sp.]|nr:ABC transporter ATP-binding protein [Candidatus Sulfotelmatobacter sp.]